VPAGTEEMEIGALPGVPRAALGFASPETVAAGEGGVVAVDEAGTVGAVFAAAVAAGAEVVSDWDRRDDGEELRVRRKGRTTVGLKGAEPREAARRH